MIFRSIKAGLRTLLRRADVDADLDAELAHYLEQATQENVRRGMPPSVAARAARMQMGGVSNVREEVLSSGWESSIDTLRSDARYGLRSVRRNPGFAAAAILTIALGIGANTVMFSVVNAVMLRPLPWRDANRLALIFTDDTRRGLHREQTAYRTIVDWQSTTRSFQDIAYYTTSRVAPMANDPGGEHGRSRAALVSANLFRVLGVLPENGRAISATDEIERAPVAVISHDFWMRWFAGSPDIIGKTLVLDDAPKGGLGTLTVVGVMPRGFYFPDRLTEIWTPATTYWRFTRESSERFSPWSRRWTAVGRLRSGSSVDDARADLARVGRQLAAVNLSPIADFPGFATTVLPVRDVIVGENIQLALWILLGAVTLVLLVACVNVASLLLARGVSRHQELAVRRALGATRGRIARQLIIESVLLAVVGGAVGTLVAIWSTRLLGSAAAGFLPRIDEISVDWRVLSFAFVASIVAGLVFGVTPAVKLSNANAADTLKEGARGTGGKQLRRQRDLLVAAECALALMLLTGAGLLLRSLAQMQAVDPGFDPSKVLMARIEFPTEPPPTAEERTQTSTLAMAKARTRAAIASRLVDGVHALPGVTSVGFIDDLFIGGPGNKSITVPGRSAGEVGSGELNDGAVTPAFFATLRVPLRSGRLLTPSDQEQKIRALWSPVITDMSLADKERLATPEPVVVNEAFVRRFFPNENPIGKKFCDDPTNKTYWYQIVGVIGDMHRQGLEHRAIPEYFGPWIPSPNGRADLVVRTRDDPTMVMAAVRERITRLIPGSTVVSITTAETQLGDFSAARRLQTWLLTTFAALALILAAIGIFGLVHFAVTERRREIGVRVALGASPGDVMRLVLRQGMREPVIGIAVGVVLSAAESRVLTGLLFGVTATDPLTFATVVVVLAVVAATACWLAGRGAMRVDPARVLRET